MSVETTVIQWVLDTRLLWPDATQTKHLADDLYASRALSLLTAEEQASVLRYYHVRDAKLALGSALLKRYVISRFCGVAWDEAVATRDERKKPIFLMPDGSQPLLFNVSHQAGLVVLLAVHNPPPGLAIGIDVVCPFERRARDHQSIATGSWASFVDMHAEVLSPHEVTALKALPLPTPPDRPLRYFYALWCLREAYVKMTGEALLAPWLDALEMRGAAPPEEMLGPVQEVWLRGQRVEDAEVRLRALLDGFMVSTAVRRGEGGQGVQMGEFQAMGMEEVVEFGEASIRQ
ncbi:Fc.00g042590.m01.CDS01 [Cosmosporella sp. VM-42]